MASPLSPPLSPSLHGQDDNSLSSSSGSISSMIYDVKHASHHVRSDSTRSVDTSFALDADEGTTIGDQRQAKCNLADTTWDSEIPIPDSTLTIRQNCLLLQTSGGGKQRVPYSQPFQYSYDIARPNLIWVNKLNQICLLGDVDSSVLRFPIFRRPSGFGKSSLLAMMCYAHDVEMVDHFASVFQARPPANNAFPPERRLVLSFDLRNIPSDARSFRERLHEYLDQALKDFLDSYSDLFNLTRKCIDSKFPSVSFSGTFDIITRMTHSHGYHILVLIDNFNDPLLKVTPDDFESTMSALRCSLVRPLSISTNYGRISGGVMVGLPHSAEAEHVRDGSHALWDIIGAEGVPYVGGAFGFSLPEVSALAQEILPSADDAMTFVRDIEEKLCPWGRDGYNMQDVLRGLRAATGQSVLDPEGW